MNNVTITISGHVGTGKSSIASLIESCLADFGFSTVVQDDEDVLAIGTASKRLCAIGKKTGITIKTQQTIRECL